MKRLACLILLSCIHFSCEKINVPDGTPSCIKQKIRKMERDPDRYGGLDIHRVELDGDYYYVFPPSRYISDGMAEMYDEYCNLVCHPWGGFSGGGSGDCPDLTNKTFEVFYEIKK